MSDFPAPKESTLVGETHRAQLQRMLQRLGAPQSALPGGARSLGQSAVECLTALLDEIDEAVMARRLVLLNGRRDTMTLEVRNRRLYLADWQSAGSGPVCADEESLPVIARQFSAFCAGGDVRVESALSVKQPRLEDAGLRPDVLRRALLGGRQGARPMTNPRPDTLLDAFVRSADRLCLAMAWNDVSVGVTTAGDTHLLAGLREALSGGARLLQDVSEGEPLGLLLGGVGDAPEVGLFFDGEAALALIAPSSRRNEIADLWSRTLAEFDKVDRSG